jgi:tetratricopeptide (TPR) repeat protein
MEKAVDNKKAELRLVSITTIGSPARNLDGLVIMSRLTRRWNWRRYLGALQICGLHQVNSVIEEMRLRLLICLTCLLLVPVGCRKSQTNGSNANTTPNSSTSSVADRSQARTFLDSGKELYRSDQDTKAAEAFQQAVKLDPDLAEAHFRLGLAYDALNKQQEAEGEYKKAVETYKKYLTENPKDAEGHYNLAQTYAGLHLYSEAVREYRQATKLKTDDADIYYDLGTALTKLAQYDEAASAFSKSLEIDPENYRAQDALDEAREGVKRIVAGKKHQEELLKKQKEDELKKGDGETPASGASKPPAKKPELK